MRVSLVKIILPALVLAMPLTGCQTTPPPPSGFTESQITLLRQEGFVETEEGWQLSLADRLLFSVNSSELLGEMQQTITRVSAGLAGVGITRARVEGHTDSTGSSEHNQSLSLMRAQSVATVMIANGFAPANLAVRGWGETRPIADNGTEEGRAENRRVVIIVTAL